MAIDNETVKRIAFLSRLKVEDENIDATKDEFNKILKWMDELNEIDTSKVEPLISVNDLTLCLRKDIVNQGKNKDAVLANAPAKEFDYFSVPKVVE